MKFAPLFTGLLVGLLSSAPSLASLPVAGQEAPDFTLKSGSGKNLRLRELRGEVVLVNFWATWCGPCRQEMPQLNRLYDQYRQAGFTLLGINIDDSPEAALVLMRKLGVRFPVLFDTDKRVSRRYDVDAMPATLLIDRDGKVRYVHRGYVSGNEVKYQTQIRELLKE